MDKTTDKETLRTNLNDVRRRIAYMKDDLEKLYAYEIRLIELLHPTPGKEMASPDTTA